MQKERSRAGERQRHTQRENIHPPPTTTLLLKCLQYLRLDQDRELHPSRWKETTDLSHHLLFAKVHQQGAALEAE